MAHLIFPSFLPVLAGFVFITSTTLKITFYMKLATMAYSVLLTGFLIRKKSIRIHSALMLSAILTDLSLVLILEYQRNAIAKAAGFTLPLLQQLHILHSVVALLLYFPMIYSGIKTLKLKLEHKPADPKLIFWHKRLGFATLYFRSAGFILMFSMIKND